MDPHSLCPSVIITGGGRGTNSDGGRSSGGNDAESRALAALRTYGHHGFAVVEMLVTSALCLPLLLRQWQWREMCIVVVMVKWTEGKSEQAFQTRWLSQLEN